MHPGQRRAHVLSRDVSSGRAPTTATPAWSEPALRVDYLAGNSKKTAVDKKTMKLIHDTEDLESSIKDKLIFLANAVIRDAKTGKAYA